MTIPEQVQNDILMHKKVKITVLRTEYYQELAEQYAIPNLGKCGVACTCGRRLNLKTVRRYQRWLFVLKTVFRT